MYRFSKRLGHKKQIIQALIRGESVLWVSPTMKRAKDNLQETHNDLTLLKVEHAVNIAQMTIRAGEGYIRFASANTDPEKFRGYDVDAFIETT